MPWSLHQEQFCSGKIKCEAEFVMMGLLEVLWSDQIETDESVN